MSYIVQTFYIYILDFLHWSMYVCRHNLNDSKLSIYSLKPTCADFIVNLTRADSDKGLIHSWPHGQIPVI